METLWTDIKALAEREAIDFSGVADLSPAHEYILEQGGPVVASFPRCVSLGIRLMDALVDGLPEKHLHGNAENYRLNAYDVVNDRLSIAVSKVAGLIQRRGYRAMPMGLMVKAQGRPLTAIFSHKLGAHLAGLGWIGKNCMLITPECGPRARWATVLTDAPLAPTGSPLGQRCGGCMECVKICPVQAYTGRNFVETEPREARYDAAKCHEYLNAMATRGEPRVCGLCLYVCPHGRK